MSIATFEIGAAPAAWTRRHLLDLESLSAEEINIVLDTAVSLREATAGCQQKLSLLSGKTIANLFFENSTRTADQLFTGRPAARRRYDRFFRFRLEPFQRRDVHRHRAEYRSDGGRCRRGAA